MSSSRLCAKKEWSALSIPVGNLSVGPTQRAMVRAPSLRGPHFWASYEVTGGARLHHTMEFSR